MTIRKTASGGQVTGVERQVDVVHTVDHPEGVHVVHPEYVTGAEQREWTAADLRQHTAARVRIDQYPPERDWTRDDELELEREDRRD